MNHYLIIQLAKQSNSAADPMGFWLVGRQIQPDDVIRWMTGGRKDAATFASFVNRSVVYLTIWQVGLQQ